MIPKIIHYCWFGKSEYPKDIEKCIKSWDILKEYGFIFMKWDETTFDISSLQYTEYMYNTPNNFAFVSDYVRLWALYNYGGIYLDTDIFLLKPFDDEILSKEYILGYYNHNIIASFIMGFEKHNIMIKKCMEWYEDGKHIYPLQMEHILYRLIRNEIPPHTIMQNNELIADVNVKNAYYKPYVKHLFKGSWDVKK